MTHEKHFLSLSYTSSFPCQPELVRGSIVKRCVYSGLCSPFCHYLSPSPTAHTHSDWWFCRWNPILIANYLLHTHTHTKKSSPCPLSPPSEKKPNVILLSFSGNFWCLTRFTFLAKCCKINGGPLNFSELRWSGWERKQAHANLKMGKW